MPANANVVIEYGPYRSNGIVDYRDDRLLGLQGKFDYSLDSRFKYSDRYQIFNFSSISERKRSPHCRS